MTEFDEQEIEFSRLLREAPCDDSPGSDHRQALRERVLAEFDRAQPRGTVHPRWKHAFQKGREIMRRPVPRLIALTTACLAIAAVWMFIPGGQSTAQAFNKLAAAVVEARTAKFQMEIQVEGQPRQKFQAYYLAPGKYRQELTGMYNVTDLKGGKIVSVIPGQKMVLVMNVRGEPRKQGFHDYFEKLRELLENSKGAKDDEYKPLGKKEIGGKQAVGFQLDSPAATVTLWGDVATGQPVLIESVWSGLPRTETVMSHFDINVDLQESLFDMKPPAGYKVQSIDVDASQPGETDLVNALKLCAEIGEGAFPDSLDTAGVTKLIVGYAVDRLKEKKEVSDEQMQELMKQSIAIGRGFQFALALAETADAHYAGKGVKQDTKDRPIFWYRPEGAKAYRVIYADLSVKDAEAAPEVEGARRLEKASKSSKPAGK
jgi:outer membrane lipoprotein-sorting protein